MSSMLNKIADAVTGHHHNANTANTSTTHSSTTTGSRTGSGVGTDHAGTNYSSTDNGALKEGAQVRDTGMQSATHGMGRSHQHDTTTTTTGTTTGTGHQQHHLFHHNHPIGSTSTTTTTTGTGLGSGVGTGSTLGSSTGSSSTLGSSSLGSRSSELERERELGMGRDRHVGSRGVEGDSTDNAMTRSEEHLLVGKEKVNVGQAALNKYVTTEKVSTSVPIIRERAVIEREPITDANREAAMRGPDFKESHYEVNLMEERAVAEKETVPIERVRLRKETEQTQQYVGAELRKEHIELVDGTKDASLGGKGLASGSGLAAGTSANRTGSAIGSGIGNESNLAGNRTATDATSGIGSSTTSSRRF